MNTNVELIPSGIDNFQKSLNLIIASIKIPNNDHT